MYEQLDLTQYLYGVSMNDIDFLMNEKQQIEYNEVCMECTKLCKQSFRCSIIQCPYFKASKGRKKTVQHV